MTADEWIAEALKRIEQSRETVMELRRDAPEFEFLYEWIESHQENIAFLERGIALLRQVCPECIEIPPANHECEVCGGDVEVEPKKLEVP